MDAVIKLFCYDWRTAIMPPSSRFPSPILVILIFVLFIANAIAEYWHLYFYVWWLDIVMHVLGGMWIAFFGLAFYYAERESGESAPLSQHSSNDVDKNSYLNYVSPRLPTKDRSNIFVISFSVALAVTIGLIWEIFEFGVAHAVGDSFVGLVDTLKDLTDDLAGALLGALIFIRGGYNKNEKA